MRPEDPGKDEELPGEIIKARQSQRGEHEKKKERGQGGGLRPHPPYALISRVCILSSIIPTIIKSAPVVMPWFTIWSTEPANDTSFQTAIPSTTYARMDTLEYAISLFMSFAQARPRRRRICL